jgi:hypothetical protein
VLAQLVGGDEEDDEEEPFMPPEPLDAAEVNRLIDKLAAKAPAEAETLRQDMFVRPWLVGDPNHLPDLWWRARAALTRARHPCAGYGLVGYVTLNTFPWSEVFLDDKKVGETPLAHIKMPAGCWKLRAVAPGGAAKELSLEVEPNRTRRYRFTIP